MTRLTLPNGAELDFGFRGEDITYRLGDRVADVSFTYMQGPRIYTETITSWRGGDLLTGAERRDVLSAAVALVRKERESPVIVINTDDPLAEEWRTICDELRGRIAGVEATSDAEKRAFQKEMFMSFVAIGKGLVVNGMELRTEADVDRMLDQLYPPRQR